MVFIPVEIQKIYYYMIWKTWKFAISFNIKTFKILKVTRILGQISFLDHFQIKRSIRRNFQTKEMIRQPTGTITRNFFRVPITDILMSDMHSTCLSTLISDLESKFQILKFFPPFLGETRILSISIVVYSRISHHFFRVPMTYIIMSDMHSAYFSKLF